MPFIPYSRDTEMPELTLSVDKYGRICLGAGLMRKLGSEGNVMHLFLYFEKETRRIGLSQHYPEGGKVRIKPFKFDSRGYTMAKNFLHHHDLEYSEGTVKYAYDGIIHGVMTFKAAVGDKRVPLSFKQEKNGNLERLA